MSLLSAHRALKPAMSSRGCPPSALLKAAGPRKTPSSSRQTFQASLVPSKPQSAAESAKAGVSCRAIAGREQAVAQNPPCANDSLTLRAHDFAEELVDLDGSSNAALDELYAGRISGMARSNIDVLSEAAILLNVSAALFGSNQVVIKLTEASMSANALSTMRFGIAALCFAAAIVKGIRNKELRKTAAELGCWLFGGYTAQALGLVYTTASRGAFTGTFTVLAVPILVGLSGRKVALTTWIAGVVALAGVGLLTTDGAEANVGDALCILSAVLFGVHKWRSEIATHKFPNNTNELFGIQLAVLASASALVSSPAVFDAVMHNDAGHLWDMAAGLPWPALVYMGLATTAFTLWVEMSALKEVPATMAALIYTTEPLWGALMAYVVMGDRWGPTGWLGAALIISASLGSQLLGDKTEKAKAE
ncbi:hypothetical protein WJX72_010202 [[Myrmecia] bisecta]|uniref:EamA domain-containing protein n=1 Tax=[Myrmecia] bisecta TaxID=41462 RepID=A0AAW1PDZ1_9CHLO